MQWPLGYLAAGLLLIGMALGQTLVKRLPITSSLVYLLIGILLGPVVLGLIDTSPLRSGPIWERITEIGVLLSLFTTGLKLRAPLGDKLWEMPVRLATISMVLTVLGIAAAAHVGLGMDWGLALVLGGLLAPTDPVLASDVSVERAGDQDTLRFSLTGEAGLNDGTAMPMVLLGLWMMGLHAEGTGVSQRFGVDLIWGAAGGVAIGAAVGTGLGRLVVYLRQKHKTALGLEEFLSLGVLALTYGLASLSHTLAFLAVFAAGRALRHMEAQTGAVEPDKLMDIDPTLTAEQVATEPGKAPVYLTQAVLGFNQQLERLYEVTVVVLIGGLLSKEYFYTPLLWFVPLLFLVIRPAAVMLGTLGACVGVKQRLLIGWFGVRGVGSLYYLAFVVNHDLPHGQAEQLIGLTLMTIAASIVVHGVSVTPLLAMYEKTSGRQATVPSPGNPGEG